MDVNDVNIAARRRPLEAARLRGPVRSRARADLRGELTEVVRRTILDAAEQVIGSKGFARARMTEVAERSGLAAGTLYNYFANKEAIFRALLDDRCDELLARLAPIAAAPGAGAEQLVRLLGTTLSYVEDHGALMLQAAESACRADHEAGGTRQYLRCLAMFEACLVAVGRKGRLRARLPAAEMAAALAGAMGGVVRIWLMGGRPGRLADRARPLVDLFVGAREASS